MRLSIQGPLEISFPSQIELAVFFSLIHSGRFYSPCKILASKKAIKNVDLHYRDQDQGAGDILIQVPGCSDKYMAIFILYLRFSNLRI